jgi:hypothetical protein
VIVEPVSQVLGGLIEVLHIRVDLVFTRTAIETTLIECTVETRAKPVGSLLNPLEYLIDLSVIHSIRLFDHLSQSD